MGPSPSPLVAAPTPLPESSSVTQLSLTVRDLSRLVCFYTQVIGLDRIEAGADADAVWVGAGDVHCLKLVADPAHGVRPPRRRAPSGWDVVLRFFTVAHRLLADLTILDIFVLLERHMRAPREEAPRTEGT